MIFSKSDHVCNHYLLLESINRSKHFHIYMSLKFEGLVSFCVFGLPFLGFSYIFPILVGSFLASLNLVSACLRCFILLYGILLHNLAPIYLGRCIPFPNASFYCSCISWHSFHFIPTFPYSFC